MIMVNYIKVSKKNSAFICPQSIIRGNLGYKQKRRIVNPPFTIKSIKYLKPAVQKLNKPKCKSAYQTGKRNGYNPGHNNSGSNFPFYP